MIALKERKKTPHLSCSSFAKCLKCEFQWCDAYVDGNWGPKGSALTFGSAMDETHNEFHRLQLEGHGNMTASQCEEFFANEMRRLADQTVWHGNEFNLLMSKGRALAKKFRSDIYPTLTPLAVQVPYFIEFMEDGEPLFALKGFSDLVAEDEKRPGVRRVIDYKTSASTWIKKDKARTQIQPAAYIFAERQMNPDVEISDEFEFIIGLKKPVKTHTIERVKRRVTEHEIKMFVARLAVMFKRMQAIRGGELAMPALAENEWWCSRKWCDAADRCEERFGVKIPDTSGGF